MEARLLSRRFGRLLVGAQLVGAALLACNALSGLDDLVLDTETSADGGPSSSADATTDATTGTPIQDANSPIVEPGQRDLSSLEDGCAQIVRVERIVRDATEVGAPTSRAT